jgi:hypothetical protein
VTCGATRAGVLLAALAACPGLVSARSSWGSVLAVGERRGDGSSPVDVDTDGGGGRADLFVGNGIGFADGVIHALCGGGGRQRVSAELLRPRCGCSRPSGWIVAAYVDGAGSSDCGTETPEHGYRSSRRDRTIGQRIRNARFGKIPAGRAHRRVAVRWDSSSAVRERSASRIPVSMLGTAVAFIATWNDPRELDSFQSRHQEPESVASRSTSSLLVRASATCKHSPYSRRNGRDS